MATSLVVAKAPCRIDFAGGFTDVPPFCEDEGGFVVNAALQTFGIRADAMPNGTAEGDRLWLRGFHGRSARRLAPFVAALEDLPHPPLRLELSQLFPVSGGLGGSGAALVAAQAAVRAFAGGRIDRARLARRAREIEVEELQQIGGGQDPVAAAFGGVLAIEFPRGSRDGVPAKLRLSARFQERLESSLFLVDTGRPRLSSGRIARVVEKIQQKHAPTLRVLRDMERCAREVSRELRREALDGALAAMVEHGRILRRLDPGIFENGVAGAIARAKSAGAVGGKPCGAGGGGCVLLFTKPGEASGVALSMKPPFAALPVRISSTGVTVRTYETKSHRVRIR
jgi:D-glycero-alpha-D-manno-heptose-7-phosphate kinase